MFFRMKQLNDTCRKLTFVIVWSVYLCFITAAAEIDATLDYEIEGDGFHSETTKLVYEHNKIIRIFHLNAPKSIACSEGEIDVELFAENANRQNITVCGQLKKSNNLLSLPLHQRYRLPQENDLYINVTLAEPTLLLGCKERIKEYGVSEIDLCAPCVDLSLKWRQIPYRMEKEKYIWSVAVGDLSDLEYVTNGTLLTVTIGTLWILRVLWSSRRDKGDKKD